MFSLLFLKEEKQILKRNLEESRLTIGRDCSADIQLCDPEISRQHCLLERRGEDYRLKDLSRNGTWVNKNKIEEVLLSPGDEIQIGGWRLQVTKTMPATAEETKIAKKSFEKGMGFESMVGISPAMKKVFPLLRKAANGEASVCLIGESGTGKELAAKSIHNLGSRRKKPFVAINCGAIPENLIESTLFGHEKGSFTGAFERQLGVFEQAHQGTLFLDEIGEMPIEAQIRLLRVLEERKIRRIGGNAEIPVNVRLITATNKDLRHEVEQGHFRQDLFYRLYVFPIPLPPLRERSEDIELLARHFLQNFSPSEEEITFSQETIEKLKTHSWQGNVRELKNVVQRALLVTQGSVIQPNDIELTSLLPKQERSEMKLLDQEKMAIIQAIHKAGGNHSKAAKHLGIARSSLSAKLKRYKIDLSGVG